MQATVSYYDPASRAGRVLSDDGVEMPFTADALAGTGLRLLRVGQRVRITMAGDRDAALVSHLQIVTLPGP